MLGVFEIGGVQQIDWPALIRQCIQAATYLHHFALWHGICLVCSWGGMLVAQLPVPIYSLCQLAKGCPWYFSRLTFSWLLLAVHILFKWSSLHISLKAFTSCCSEKLAVSSAVMLPGHAFH